jgi:hypothetical protein
LYNKPLVFGSVNLDPEKNEFIKNQDGIPKIIPKPVQVVINSLSHNDSLPAPLPGRRETVTGGLDGTAT